MTQFILRGWAYISLVVLLCAALYWLLKTSTVIGLVVLILGVGSLYMGLFAKIAYGSKLRDEEYAVREAERAARQAEREAADAERNREWKEAEVKRQQDRAEREKLAELERKERQKRILELEGKDVEQAG